MKKRIIRIALILVGIAGLTWLMNPLLLHHRIFNIGNLSGSAALICIVLYGIFFNRINRWIKRFIKKRAGKIITAFLCIIFARLIGLVGAETALMARAASNAPDGAATLVVLGCQVIGKSPSLMLGERLNAAYNYLIENPEARCIVSGGQGADEQISEAECMFNYLVSKGISPDRIYKEDQSTSTKENLLFSQQIIEKYGLNRNIAIATNEFHEYRAGLIANELGIKSKAVSAGTAWWLFPTYYLRELYGIVYEWIT